MSMARADFRFKTVRVLLIGGQVRIAKWNDQKAACSIHAVGHSVGTRRPGAAFTGGRGFEGPVQPVTGLLTFKIKGLAAVGHLKL